ncbi:MAG: endonuclease/exonuclease/phosphatase family protein [Parabacteroides sp.]|nr:endonuclease/exonuclease/phosphatase family protein [Parabacteroides sp.]
MKISKVISLFFLLFIFSFKGISQDTNQQTLKIISYNIWNGFEKNAARKARFVDWMNEQKPQIVVLEELVGFTEKDLSELATSYGHPYVAIVKEEGYPVGLTSCQPIRVIKKQVEGFWHGMLHVQTYGLDIIVTHLSPFEWDYRLKEATAITQYIRENGPNECLVMGDFNAYSPFDADEVETHTELKKIWRNGIRNIRNMEICVVNISITPYYPNSYPSVLPILSRCSSLQANECHIPPPLSTNGNGTIRV